MTKSRFSPKVIIGIILVLFFGVALYLRIALPYDQVFSGDWIKFTGVDAYYHMRLVDNLIHNFPQGIPFDPYTFYPHGTTVPWPPFFDWLIAGIAWLVGLGSPTRHTIDVVGVYFPAVLGALTVIPVYFIGKELFNRWAGILSAGLIALLPGEFLGRSILGFTDHHVAEVLFTTITMLFLILAIKTARQRQLTFNHLKRRDWPTITKPLICSLLAGISLGIYLLSWVGGLLFVFLIFAYFVIQFITDHLRGKSTDYLGIVGTLSLLTASVISLPLLPQAWLSPQYLPSLAIAVLTPVILASLSRLMANIKLKPAYYPLTLFGLSLVGLAIFYVVNPSLLKSMVARFGIFTPAGASLTIVEVNPLLFPGGNFSLSIAWGNFTTGFFLSFISLGILIYFIIKRGEAGKTLFVVWSLTILAATLGQRRFAYYFAVNVAVLTGYLSWLILGFAGFKEAAAEPIAKPKKLKTKRKKVKPKKPQKGGFRVTASHMIMALAVVVVFFLSFFPNISPAMNTASQARFAPDDAWCEALSWLKDNTPEPFEDPDFYYELCETPFHYPETAYSIMSWWDYGHWITRIAHRIPISNPFQQGASQAARFFTAQDEDSANQMMDRLGSRYVIIDHEMPTTTFHAMPAWAGSTQDEFYETYYQPLQGGKLKAIILFYPAYYNSIVVRLYNFDGKAVVPRESIVISYEEKISKEGIQYKQITGYESFSTYEAAADYLASHGSGNYRIVSTDPLTTPVPLEELNHYKLIYESNTTVMIAGKQLPGIRIFEYVRRGES